MPLRDLTLELPFTLTQPKPKPIISQMITLPSAAQLELEAAASQADKEDNAETTDTGVAEKDSSDAVTVKVRTPAALAEPRPSMTSIYDAIDHNLINFDV